MSTRDPNFIYLDAGGHVIQTAAIADTIEVAVTGTSISVGLVLSAVADARALAGRLIESARRIERDR